MILLIGIQHYKGVSDDLPAVFGDILSFDNLWKEVFDKEDIPWSPFSISYAKLDKFLDKWRDKINESPCGKFDGLIVCVSSHGDEGCIDCSDGKCFEIKDIIGKFDKAKCKNLIGRPKIFYFDSCRGNKEVNKVDCGKGTRRRKGGKGGRTKYTNISTDLFVHYACMEGYVAWTNENDQMSFFSNEVIDAFSRWIPYGKTLNSISTKINHMVNHSCEGDQTSVFQTNLTYEVQFPQKKL